MDSMKKHGQIALLVVAASLLTGPLAIADVVIDWDVTACNIVVDAKLGPPPANRVMATVQTAVYEAVNAISKRYPAGEFKLQAAPGASVDAAVAAANRATLAKLLPSQQAAIDSVYQAALAKVPDGGAKTAGIAVGEQAAAAILALRAEDSAAAVDTYRPYTTAGVYVPTMMPAVTQWPQRKPWLMTSSAQFRPGPPPKLTTEVWARDYNEIKAIGGKNSTRRTAEQTEIARFWEATLPPIYHGVVRSVAEVPGRDVTQNARLFAAVTQAMDDALIAVFEAKYYYNFWRPVTAIRNGDIDGNDATERDPSWTPFIDTPMHPEYPCAHCIVSGAVGTVLKAEIGTGPTPTLTTTSPTAKGAARSWTKIDDFVQEVAEARICDGVHYRNSTEVGTAMGKQVGALAVAKFLLGSNQSAGTPAGTAMASEAK
jgi:PAP2 superfamily